MFPYILAKPEIQEADYSALLDILEDSQPSATRPTNHMLAMRLQGEGFSRRKVNRVSTFQMWSYVIETLLLSACAVLTFGKEPFAFGASVALALGSAATYAGGLIINQAIKHGDK